MDQPRDDDDDLDATVLRSPGPGEVPDASTVEERRRRAASGAHEHPGGRDDRPVDIPAARLPTSARRAVPGDPETPVYRPRRADPVRAARTEPAPHVRQQPADAAREERRSRARRRRARVVLAGLAIAVIAVGAALLVCLLVMP